MLKNAWKIGYIILKHEKMEYMYFDFSFQINVCTKTNCITRESPGQTAATTNANVKIPELDTMSVKLCESL